GLGVRGAAGGGDRVVPGGRVLVGEGQRRPCLAQVPGQVAGEHADQHVRFDAFFEPVEHRPQVQVVGLHRPEVALDVPEVFVGGHHAGRAEFGGRDGGADDVDPVEGGFVGDLRLAAGDGQAVIGDGDVEVLTGLVLADHLAGLDPDLRGAAQPPGGHSAGDGGQQLPGRLQQVLALAGALFGEHRVAAGDQALAGEVR